MMADATVTNTEPESLDGWIQLLSKEEIPIFSNTAQKIFKTLGDNKKGAMELASDILQDPNLTAKLLKIANSSYYNPSKQSLSTISRAIVILGSETIRELTVACSYFESILSTQSKAKANEEIGNAIHAAVQAKAMAVSMADTSPEEIFIASLLNNIGNIAFWCYSDKQGERILDLTHNGSTTKQAEKQVLGFTLQKLGASLSKLWNLSGLTEQAIIHPEAQNPRTQTIKLSHEIAEAVKQGWDSRPIADCISKIADLTGQSKTIIKQQLQNNTNIAVKIAQQFGAHDASKFIQKTAHTTDGNAPESEELPIPVTDKKQLQFQILQEISTLMSGSININVLIETILEGIHRGVGMDRTLFLLQTADKKTLKEKFSLGWLKESYVQKISFNLTSMPVNLFYHAFHSQDGIWAQPANDEVYFSPHVINTIGLNECFLFPILVDDEPIGLIYADRAIQQQPLSHEELNAVRHFTLQANIGLKMYRLRKTP